MDTNSEVSIADMHKKPIKEHKVPKQKQPQKHDMIN